MSEAIQPWPVLKRGSQGHPVPLTWRALVSGMLSG